MDPPLSRRTSEDSPGRGSGGSAVPIKDALVRTFLSERDWNTILTGVSDEDLRRVAEEQPATFWNRSPIADSAAYRIFGALGRRDATAAIAQAIAIFNKSDIDREIAQACLRWAVMGIFENAQSSSIEPHLAQCPPEQWRGLIQGAIGGSDTGGVVADMQSFQMLLNRLLNPEGAPRK